MGFQRSTLKLTFEGEFEGLEIRARRMTVDESLSLVEFANIEKVTGERRGEMLYELYALLDRKIIDWNYEDESGAPVDKNVNTIADLDQVMLFAIVNGLLEAQTAVAPPLPPSSSDGIAYPGLSLPMEPLSPNPSS